MLKCNLCICCIAVWAVLFAGLECYSYKTYNYRQISPDTPFVTSLRYTTVPQHEATILYLRRQVFRAPEGSIKRKEAQKALDAELSQRKYIDDTFQEIAKALFDEETSYEILETVRPAGPAGLRGNGNCFKIMVKTHNRHCGALSTYGFKYTAMFFNLCNAGVHQSQLAKVASEVCGKYSINHDIKLGS